MASVGDILNDDGFFGDVADTRLKSAIDRGKANLLGHKWTYERMGKASNEVINKTYGEYKQCELDGNGEKTGKVLGRYVINLYATRISR